MTVHGLHEAWRARERTAPINPVLRFEPDGLVLGAGWNLPPGYPNFSSTWIEITGTEGALILDDTHRDVWLNTVADGTRFPMSTMPGEQVDHVFAGQMGPETIHFLESCLLDRPVMVKPEHARMVMQVYQAADLSAETGQPVEITVREHAPEIPSLA